MTTIPTSVEELLRGDVDVAVRAPGRANLIGEHTDYNEGLVLPIAIEQACFVVGRSAGQIRLSSNGFDEDIEVDPITGVGGGTGWGRYVAAVVRSLHDAEVPVRGLAGTITSDVPVGAGLSSSAALEVSLGLALSERELAALELAQICQRAENVHVGVRSGIMDQLVSTSARKNHACLIDCRTNSVEHVPLPDDIAFVLVDSGVQRTLAGSGYNARREECERAASELGVLTLRDVRATDLPEAKTQLEEDLYLRVRHVVNENERVVATTEALAARDYQEVAQIFAASYRSYAEDFEASTPEIDELVAVARRTPGVVAARLTGGGWGGCTVNIVEREAAERAAADIVESYKAAVGLPARSWVTQASEGAARII